MSRTDVHRPPFVQESDPHNRHLFAEVHDHRNGACTLGRYLREGWFPGCCHVQYRGSRNIYCGCAMCTQQVWHRQERRRQRHTWKRRLRRGDDDL